MLKKFTHRKEVNVEPKNEFKHKSELLKLASEAINKHSKIKDPVLRKNLTDKLVILLEGNMRYVKRRYVNLIKTSDRDKLLSGQSPIATIITCSDSRVKTDKIFDANEGIIFDVQTAGHTLSPSSVGSLEYGLHLSPLLIVLGHEKCGAVTTAYNKIQVVGELAKIISQIKINIAQAKSLDEAIVMHTLKTVEYLKTSYEVLKMAYENGELAIIPMYYHLGEKVEILGIKPNKK